MMMTADIGFSTIELPVLQERRLVEDRFFYATFLLCIFSFAKHSSFLFLSPDWSLLLNYSLMNHLTPFYFLNYFTQPSNESL